MLFASEIDFREPTAVLLRGFPANLAAQTGFITRSLQVGQAFEEIGQNRFEKVPVLCAAGNQPAQPQFIPVCLVDVDRRQVTLPGSGYIKAETEAPILRRRI